MNQLVTQGLPQGVVLPAYAVNPQMAAQAQRMADQLMDTGGIQVPRIVPNQGRFNFDYNGQPVSDPGPLRVAVVNFLPKMSRSFYEGAYDPATPAAPTCWSADGITPDNEVPVNQRQCTTCSGCAKAQKGSKMVDNRPMTACSIHRRIVLQPAGNLGSRDHLYVMQVNATSCLGRDMPNGYMGFNEYLGWFRQRVAAGTPVMPQYAITEIAFLPPNMAEAPNHMAFRITEFLPEDTAARMLDYAQTDPTVQLYLHGQSGPKDATIPLLPAAPAAAVPPGPTAAPQVAPAPAPVQQAPAAGFGSVHTPPAQGFGAPTQPVAPSGMAGFAAAAPAPAPTGAIPPATAPAKPPGRRGARAATQQPAQTQPAAPVTGFGAPAQQAAPATGFGAAPPQPVAPPPAGPGGFGAAAAPATGFGAAVGGFAGFADTPQ